MAACLTDVAFMKDMQFGVLQKCVLQYVLQTDIQNIRKQQIWWNVF